MMPVLFVDPLLCIVAIPLSELSTHAAPTATDAVFPSPAMDMTAIRAHVASELDTVTQIFYQLAEKRTGATASIHGGQWLTEALAHTVNTPGKLLRPLLCLLACKATLPANNTLTPQHATTAAVAELIHVATLLHDDVLDDADTRRGQPTVRTGWNNTVAILTGDYLLAQASRLLAQLGEIRLVGIYSDVLADLCDGEVEQLRTQHVLELNWPSYMQKTLCKTASLFAAVCESAGVLNTLPEDNTQALKQFGQELGLAFQLIDDVLDYQSTRDITGKPVLSDLRQGLITAPILLAFEDNRLTSADQAALTDAIHTVFDADSTETAQQHALATIQPLLEKADTYNATRTLALQHYHTACTLLATVVPNAEKRAPLEHLGQLMIHRKA